MAWTAACAYGCHVLTVNHQLKSPIAREVLLADWGLLAMTEPIPTNISNCSQSNQQEVGYLLVDILDSQPVLPIMNH